MRRIRNIAFLGLLVTLVWAGSVNLRADSGGYFCAYGYCMLTYDNCDGNWMHDTLPQGQCVIRYQVLIAGGGGTCQINLASGSGYNWIVTEEGACGDDHWCFLCYAE
jgi:hypothetical protein